MGKYGEMAELIKQRGHYQNGAHFGPNGEVTVLAANYLVENPIRNETEDAVDGWIHSIECAKSYFWPLRRLSESDGCRSIIQWSETTHTARVVAQLEGLDRDIAIGSVERF